MRPWSVLMLVCLAGPVWAGEADVGVRTAEATADAVPAQSLAQVAEQAWVAEYRLRDARGERALVVVRSEDRIEYRAGGEPVRVWQRIGDGVEHREIFPDDRRVVVYAPGDLRALDQVPDWATLGSLVAPALRSQLKAAGSTQVAGQPAERLRGALDGTRVQLDWMTQSQLPARYRRQTAAGKVELTLIRLEQRPTAEAFADTTDYRELDYADIGDMELDSFARRYIRQGF